MTYTSACSISNITDPVYPTFPPEISVKTFHAVSLSDLFCTASEACGGIYNFPFKLQRDKWLTRDTGSSERAVDVGRNDLLVWRAAQERRWNGAFSIWLILQGVCQWEDQNHNEDVPVHPLYRVRSRSTRASALAHWLLHSINFTVSSNLFHRGRCLAFLTLPKHSRYAE